MKYLILFFLLLAPSFADAVWFDSSWDYRFKVEVVNSKVGTTSAVINFPVYFDLAGAPAGFWSNVQGDGDDIRVVESDETTETPFELVSISTSTNRGELHFLADSLATTSTSTFWIYYGNPSASKYANADTYGRNNVWKWSYRLVHHATSSAQASDSTSNSFNGTPTNMDASNVVAGRVGSSSYDFNGSDEYVTRGTDDATLDPGTNPWGFSLWLDADDWTSVVEGFFSKKTSDGGGGYEFYKIDGLRVVDTSGSLEDYNATDVVTAAGGWELLHFMCSPSTGCDIWKNGSPMTLSFDDGTYTSVRASTNAFMYGRAETRNYFNGRIDEIRFSSSTLSSAYIRTEYNNQSSTSTFFVVGAQESEPAAGGDAAPAQDIIWFSFVSPHIYRKNSALL